MGRFWAGCLVCQGTIENEGLKENEKQNPQKCNTFTCLVFILNMTQFFHVRDFYFPKYHRSIFWRTFNRLSAFYEQFYVAKFYVQGKGIPGEMNEAARGHVFGITFLFPLLVLHSTGYSCSRKCPQTESVDWPQLWILSTIKVIHYFIKGWTLISYSNMTQGKQS
jgi:hypothetical protein